MFLSWKLDLLYVRVCVCVYVCVAKEQAINFFRIYSIGIQKL